MGRDTPILPSVYFGNIAYFHILLHHEKVLIDLNEPYQKQTFRSRCEYLSANGIAKLSIPVIRPNGKATLMKEVEISNAENWRKDHLKAIESAYARTPYYIYYIDAITAILQTDHQFLWELNEALLKYCIEKVGLTVGLSYTEQQHPLKENDWRIIFSLKKQAFETKRYIQTFEERFGFQNNLSILDLLFNEGPNTISVLQESNFTLL